MPEIYDLEIISSLKEIINSLENSGCNCKEEEQEKRRCKKKRRTKELGKEEDDKEGGKDHILPSDLPEKKKKKLDKFGREEMEFLAGCNAPEYVKYPPGFHPLVPYPRAPEIIELRGSDLIKGCACLKRNGLQTDCELKKCKGNVKCTFYPTPVCEPSGLGPPRVYSDFIKRPEGSCELTSQKVTMDLVGKKPLTDAQKKKILQRRKIQDEAEKELYEKVQKEIKDRTSCKRVDCNYIKKNPTRNVKIQTDIGQEVSTRGVH